MKIKNIGRMPTKEDLKTSLAMRVLPMKFCYPEEGGNKWHKLRRESSYQLGKRELRAFEAGLSEVEKIIGNQPVNIVHLGPGDGIEIPFIFTGFDLSIAKYAGVDISEQMLFNTNQLNRKYFSKTNPLWYLTDIEIEGNLRRVCEDVKINGVNTNLILLTNQGVLLSNPKTLQNVHDAMQYKDYLFITIEGDDVKRREEIILTYNLPSVRNLLSVGLERAGLQTRNGRFRTKFNDCALKVEVYFKSKKNLDVLCLASYKPREDEFRKRLTKDGFNIEYFRFYEDTHTFAVLCKKGGKNV